MPPKLAGAGKGVGTMRRLGGEGGLTFGFGGGGEGQQCVEEERQVGPIEKCHLLVCCFEPVCGQDTLENGGGMERTKVA